MTKRPECQGNCLTQIWKTILLIYFLCDIMDDIGPNLSYCHRDTLSDLEVKVVVLKFKRFWNSYLLNC